MTVKKSRDSRWIFHPSYDRWETGRLNLSHAMASLDYTQVIVVRPNQYYHYVMCWGATHIVIQLPGKLPQQTA